MIASDLLPLLWCPTCQGAPLALRHGTDSRDAGGPRENQLRCAACFATYPVRFGFPTLFPRGEMDGPAWSLWSDHLEKFQARRDARLREPERALNRIAGRSQPQPSFAKFVDITEGTVLDVGCGPGKFRHHFDGTQVRYVGLDPIALPDVGDFTFVQGLGEFLPFKDRTFTDVVVLAALDHFRDLPRFLAEVRRVLVDGGRLHVLQSVHEVRGPISAIKVLAHKMKDAIEERASPHGREVPKHLTEFTRQSLEECIGTAFEIASVARYSATWYSPDKLFLSFRAKKDQRSVSPDAIPEDRGDVSGRMHLARFGT